MALHVIGVRHHSPACARLVRHVIRATRPTHVLIEGPADMNARLDELALDHEPPLAIFTWFRGAARTHASWTPLCAYSPEWLALREGRAAGADVRFMDLPAWHPAFAGVRNRYADRPAEREHHERYTAALCERLGVDDDDTLWDHLFEQPAPPDALRERLDAYFLRLRGDTPASERDAPREAYMARCVAWALAEPDAGDVVVVCGGWHQPPLLAVAPAASAEPFPAFEVPAEEAEDPPQSWLVPYSYRRLDAFAGYESGMPSPGFYDLVWSRGAEAAADGLLDRVVARLRAKRQPVSTADLVATRAMAETLGRMRGHATLTRTDVLDAVAGALVKDALEVPLPWSRRGRLLPGTDPMLVEVVAALAGDARGRLAPGTPRPPLVLDVAERLRTAGLAPERASRQVTLALTDEADLVRSRILHALRVLGVPGFTRTAGPAWATDAELKETWEIRADDLQEPALIEAGAYGATLDAAALALLEEAVADAAGDIDALAALLGDAVFVGVEGLAGRALTALDAGVRQTHDLGALGRAVERTYALWRHGDLLGATGAAPLAAVLEAGYERALWLVEGLSGPDLAADDAHLRALAAVRELLRPGPMALEVDPGLAFAVMTRRAHDADAPPAIRGAALGLLWALDGFPDAATAAAEATRAVRAMALPKRLGDFLAGLFALAREEVTSAAALVGVLDEVQGALTDDDFLVALPSLRMAYSWFPPRDRERLARLVLRRYGADDRGASSLLRAQIAPEVVAAGLALESTIDGLMARYGLVGEVAS